MRWQIAEAKQKFSDLVRQAAAEPQLIFNRERLVAAIVDPQTFQAFQAWNDRERRRSLADAFEELRRIAGAEGYSWGAPTRVDRQNAFVDALDDVSR